MLGSDLPPPNRATYHLDWRPLHTLFATDRPQIGRLGNSCAHGLV